MAKKILPSKDEDEKIDIIIEAHEWTGTPSRFTWRHGVILALILAGAILFAFGFLIIAGVLLLAAVVYHIIAFILKKLA